PRVGGEPDEQAFVPVALTRELTDVQLAASTHCGGSRITDVGVVLPYDDFRSPQPAVEMLDKRVECAGHVPVSEVPRRNLGPVHLLVVLLRVTGDTRVLLREELLVLGNP